jgi:FemAB-related protein (PEP-CTERM system-associated)
MLSLASPDVSHAEGAGHLDCATACDTDAAAWDAFVLGHADGSNYHRYAWRGVIERVFRHRAHYLFVRDGHGRIEGVLPLVRMKSVLFGDFLVSVPFLNYGGALAATAEAATCLITEAERLALELGVSHVEFRHVSNDLPAFPSRVDKVSMRLDLPSSADQLRRRLPAAVRSQIKRPEREGATTVSGGAELLDEFYAVFAENMRDLGTPVYPKAFFADILRTFAGEARIFIARIGEAAAAGGLTLGHRRMLEIPWASSLRRYNRTGVNMLLYWKMLEHAIESGYACFDFGRSTPDSGTYRFKKQWGALPVQLHWHYWLRAGGEVPLINPANPRYGRAVAAWQRLPLPVANVLGPRIVRNIP